MSKEAGISVGFCGNFKFMGLELMIADTWSLDATDPTSFDFDKITPASWDLNTTIYVCGIVQNFRSRTRIFPDNRPEIYF